MNKHLVKSAESAPFYICIVSIIFFRLLLKYYYIILSNIILITMHMYSVHVSKSIAELGIP